MQTISNFCVCELKTTHKKRKRENNHTSYSQLKKCKLCKSCHNLLSCQFVLFVSRFAKRVFLFKVLASKRKILNLKVTGIGPHLQQSLSGAVIGIWVYLNMQDPEFWYCRFICVSNGLSNFSFFCNLTR